MREFLSTRIKPKLKLEADTTVNLDNSMSAATINALIAAQPKNLGGYTLTFQFADGTYTMSEKLVFHDFHGGGYLQIYGNASNNSLSTTKAVHLDFSGTDGLDGIEAKRTSGIIKVYYLKVSSANVSNHVRAMTFESCSDVRCYYNYVTASAAGSYGQGYHSTQSTFLAYWCYVTGFNIAFYMSYASQNYIRDCDESGTQPYYGIYANAGAIVGRYGTYPSASTLDFYEVSGAEIHT